LTRRRTVDVGQNEGEREPTQTILSF